MLATIPTTSRLLGKPLTDEDAQTSSFICEVGNIIVGVDEGLNDALAQFADDFEISEQDYRRVVSARQQLLRCVCSFLLQRPVVAREVVSENLLTVDAVDTFFFEYKSNPTAIENSPVDEMAVNMPHGRHNDELETLRKENARLQLEVQNLRREKELMEAQALNALRRKPRRHNRQTFSSLDEMLTGMMKDAVAEGIREVLGDKANV